MGMLMVWGDCAVSVDAGMFQTFNAAEFSASNATAPVVLTRRGDGVMCVRFWGEITRGVRPAAVHHLLTRAFHPKARSHHPITAPSVVGVGAKWGAEDEFEAVCDAGLHTGSIHGGHGWQVVASKASHISRAVAKLGSDPNSGQVIRACQKSITELGSDPNLAVPTKDLNLMLADRSAAAIMTGSHDD